MALQVWLPLIKNLENKGLSSVSVTNNGATLDTTYNAKLGGCYRFNKDAYLSIDKKAVTNATECSFSLWLNINSFNAGYDTYIQLGLGTASWVSYTMGLLRNNKNSNLLFAVSDGTTSSQTSFTTPNITLGTWYHITCVYKTGHCLIYINGELHSDNTTAIVPNFSAITAISVGGLPGTYKTDSYINDVRIYDHALSAKEVKEISKGLICHYPLNDYSIDINSNFAYDTSGYCHNGTLSPTKPTVSVDSPRYSSCMTFNGSNNYVAIGRAGMVKDSITISVWAYMDDWSPVVAINLLGAVEGGTGCALKFNNSKVRFVIAVGTEAGTAISCYGSSTSELSSGWHLFTGVYDGINTYVYLDGVLSGSVEGSTKNPIFHHATNGMFIGAEAGTSAITPASPYFNGKISDVRIYATALSAQDVLELYQSPVSIDNTGKIHALEYSEV